MANASPLTLMTSPLSVTNQTVTPFGMLGGLVPVTMPFQFPLELLGFGTDTAGVTATSGSTSAALHHGLTQSKWGSILNEQMNPLMPYFQGNAVCKRKSKFDVIKTVFA